MYEILVMSFKNNTIRKDDIILGNLSKSNFKKKKSEYHNISFIQTKIWILLAEKHYINFWYKYPLFPVLKHNLLNCSSLLSIILLKSISMFIRSALCLILSYGYSYGNPR